MDENLTKRLILPFVLIGGLGGVIVGNNNYENSDRFRENQALGDYQSILADRIYNAGRYGLMGLVLGSFLTATGFAVETSIRRKMEY